MPTCLLAPPHSPLNKHAVVMVFPATVGQWNYSCKSSFNVIGQCILGKTLSQKPYQQYEIPVQEIREQ
jgi:hypothetical protein